MKQSMNDRFDGFNYGVSVCFKFNKAFATYKAVI